ncbi:MAG: enoyl-CoA hydratase/isomerase family protein [Spirochaetota bacterium]|nr:enoyl-CoA hydratase/isomerase family protein [Spirochaetota bacterium]
MEWVKWDIQEDVALLIMDHNVENRFSGDFTKEIRQALAEIANNGYAKALVITGAHEKFFCNGLDLDWMNQQDHNIVIDFLYDISHLLRDTAIFPKPLIGAINGHAFGMGAIWSSGFDFRIMREDRGWVCFPEMDINIPFWPGMIAICEHGLGKRLFREMAWTAKRYGGAEAVDIGWARQALPREELISAAMEFASFMAKKAQPAFAVTKRRWAKAVVDVIEEQDPEAIRSSI